MMIKICEVLGIELTQFRMFLSTVYLIDGNPSEETRDEKHMTNLYFLNTSRNWLWSKKIMDFLFRNDT